MRYLFTLCFALFVVMTASAQLTNGLVAHWDFNGNVNDATGNGMNGTPNAITYTTGKNGVANTAASFNGSSSSIDVAYNPLMNNTNFTICAVVKVNGFYSGLCQANTILWRGNQFSNGYYSLIYFDNPFDSNCGVSSPNNNVFASQVGTLGGNGSTWNYTPGISLNRWYCVVTTYDGTDSKVYVDGVLKSTYRVLGPPGNSSSGLAIGANKFNAFSTHPYWMNGALDDLRLYNRVLTKLEIDSFCGITTTTPEVSISQPVAPTSFCVGAKFNLNYTVTGPFNTGNIFTAQLSNAAGSFASPVNIGSVTATGAGIISCTIPANTPAGAGYRVRISASNPAKLSADNGVNLTVNRFPSVATSGNSNVCLGKPLTINSNVSPPGTTITWTLPGGTSLSNPNVTIAAAAYKDSGMYILTTTHMGCTRKDTVWARVSTGTVNLGPDTTICSYDTLILSPALPGMQLEWGDGSTADTLVIKQAGKYTVASTLGVCKDTDTINVKMQQMALQDLPKDTVVCTNTKIDIILPDSFDAYQWNDPTNKSHKMTIDSGGRYWVKVYKNGCVAGDTMMVKPLYPYFTMPSDTKLCNGDKLRLIATSVNGSKYEWQDGSTADYYDVTEKGVYEVRVTNVCGTFTGKSEIDFRQCECEPFLPGAFTPNGDGWNDAIKPILNCNPARYHFIIANRRGQIVFESKNPQERWDGSFKGSKAGIDTYYYYLKLTSELGNVTEHKGDILLIR